MVKYVMKKLAISTLGILVGLLLGYYVIFYTSILPFRIQTSSNILINPISPQKQVIGFLPYWLLGNASNDYSKYISTLTYFGLRIDTDGTILKVTNRVEGEPGWVALNSGRAEPFLKEAENKNLKLSLAVVNGSNQSIDELISDPIPHAKNFIEDVTPILNKYNFKDLNLDIEYTHTATSDARKNFTTFVSEVRKMLNKNISLTVEITGDDAVKPDLIDPKAMGKLADYIVLMAYDFHFPGSFVSGPVAPISGAGIMSEYDVTSASEKAISQIPSQKLILGIPLYGYEWESLSPNPRYATIPNSGVVASSRRAQELANSCSNCTVSYDKQADERYLTYFNSQTNSYHIIFYPDKSSTVSKINLANNLRLGGIALWALGYEDSTILIPLEGYGN